MTRLHDLAVSNGGKFLDKEWRGPYHKYNFEFANGLVFKRTGRDMLSKGWPAMTYYLHKLNKKNREYFEIQDPRLNKIALEKFKAMVESYNAQLLEGKWHGSDFLYKIKLSSGVEIKRSAIKVKNNGLPLKAINNSDKLGAFKLQLSREGITLLEEKWLGYETPHRMQFADGREFTRSPAKIKERGLPKNADGFFKRRLSQGKI